MKNNIIIQCFAGETRYDSFRVYTMFRPAGTPVYIPGCCVRNHQFPQEYVPKTYVAISPKDLCDYLARMCASNTFQAIEAKNLLDLMSFFRFGISQFNVYDGMPDFKHPHHRITWKPDSEAPGFGQIPESGHYSLVQQATYWLLSHLPFVTGQVQIEYRNGVPWSVVMETDNYIRISQT